MRRLLRRLRARLEPALLSDEAFIEAAYVEILGRPADQDGVNHYRALLRQGLGRTAVLLSLMRSDEFRKTLTPASSDPVALPNLRALRPERYASAIDRTNNEQVWTFEAESDADFDWLEQAILEHGYYEKPGVWNLGVDTDKRVIAEMIAAFAPASALELGCAAGAVLECLEPHGVLAEGVEISSMAIARAPESVRARIHQGDLLTLSLSTPYDLVFGLDVFEHLNPNKLDAYISRIAASIAPGGYAFCNVPAFGDDPHFGTVFPLYLDAWREPHSASGLFTTLHVDALGYPIHGHLTWATAAWWVAKFDAHGLRRDVGIERALHEKYDGYFEKRAPARKAFFVFSKDPSPARTARIIDTVARTPSAALRA